MKANIPPFAVGQKVVYLRKCCLNEGMIYPPKNANVILCDINFNLFGRWACKISGFEFGKNGENQWFTPEEFAPLQDQPAPLLTFEKIKETEKEEILIMN